MKDLVILAILSGWLAAELKEFFINGGISNALAFSLLKIIFIIALILVVGAITTSYEIFRTVRNIATMLELPGIIAPGPRAYEKLPSSNINNDRKNSF